MIISVSRRTDIPAFYGEWLMNRLDAGFADVVNPFNPRQVRRVDLRPEAVDAIVFWTRNPRPLFRRLKQIDDAGYNFYFLYTFTGYPKSLEPNLPSNKAAMDSFRGLSDRIGPQRVIWRYDPIALSSITGHEFHLRNFESICKALRGSTERVIVSSLDFYAKTARRLKALTADAGIEWHRSEAGDKQLIEFMRDLERISCAHGIYMQSCAEEIDFAPAGIAPGQCVDYELVNRLFGGALPYRKDSSQRKKCLCGISADIGAYNTCGYRCVYCYANSSFETAKSNLNAHDSNATSLSPRRRADEKA